MRILKPPALRHGDLIAVAAPASPEKSEANLSKGIRYLESLGYRVVVGEHVCKKRGYLAGSDVQRATDLNRFFSDPHVKAIFTLRGGFGSQRLLPFLDFGMARRHPKILVGYSDITALHLALYSHVGLVTFSGPMVAVEMAEGLHGSAEERFWRTLTSALPPDPLRHRLLRSRSAERSKSTVGRLMGGNLSLISGLMGTTFFPREKNLLWLFEEIGERPYRVDRMLEQLVLGGVVAASKGVLLGRFSDCGPEAGKPSLTLKQIFDEKFATYSHPVGTGVRFGHFKNSRTIPWGVRVRVDDADACTRFLEGGVS
jgi:muramoyltetrapeptide carboxypeptidase